MNNPESVCRIESTSYLLGNRNRPRNCERPLSRKQGSQVPSRHILHGDEWTAIFRFINILNGNGILMAQLARNRGFALEPFQ